MSKPNFLDLPPEYASRETSRYHIIPVPYDGTSTWQKGSDKGPSAIIDASSAIEWYDIETQSEPCHAGVWTETSLTHTGTPEDLEPKVRSAVRNAFTSDRLPIVLGGEHSVSIGAINAAADAFDDLTVLQIDAHADTRETYQGSSHNHACVMARAKERCPVLQVGIRAIDASEQSGLHPDRTVYGHQIISDPDQTWIDSIVSKLTKHTYITFDLDAFDPSILPATGTPEPGGLSWLDAISLIDTTATHSKIVGFDVVELCPQPGQHASAFIAAKLVYRIIAAIESNR